MKMPYINKIILGTVQFGLDYGINNVSGQVSPTEVMKILSVCKESCITKLDTSAAYGNSEKILGEFIKSDFDVISKYPGCSRSVESVFNNTLADLGVNRIYGYLIHHFNFFKEHTHIWEDIFLLKETGKIKKIGFSIYNIDELNFLFDNNIEFDLIQFPYNIFDRRFDPYLYELKKRNVEIHIRSVFLQGLFFKDLNLLNEKIRPLKSYLLELREFCKKRNYSIESFALNYVLHNQYIDGVLIGVDNADQLKRNIDCVWDIFPTEEHDFIYSINVKEKELLHPNNWN